MMLNIAVKGKAETPTMQIIVSPTEIRIGGLSVKRTPGESLEDLVEKLRAAGFDAEVIPDALPRNAAEDDLPF